MAREEADGKSRRYIYRGVSLWAEGARISYLRTPLLRNGLSQTSNAGFGQAVVRLACISVRTARARDIDDNSLFTILDPEVRRSLPDQPEGRGVVNGDDSVPLLVCGLVDNAIPRVTGIVNDDVDLAISKLRRLRNKHREVVGVCHVARDRDRPTRRSVIDGFGYSIGFCTIHIADNDFGALVREESSGFLADPLSRACDL